MKMVRRKVICMALAVAMLLSLCTAAGAVQVQQEKSAVFSVEAFSIGNGYVVEPVWVSVSENENAAQVLDRLLTQNGIAYDYAGTLQENYYLKTLYVENSANIPQCIVNEIGDYIDEGSGTKLGEYEYTALAGWLITVNGAPLNVGLCDYYPAQGDVVRVQFSLYYGADIGLAEAMEMDKWMGIYDFYPVAQKEAATCILAQIHQDKSVLENEKMQNLYNQALEAVQTVNTTQNDLNQALFALVSALHDDIQTGDANLNGTLEVADVLLIQKYIARSETMTVLQQAVSDTDENGLISVEDVLAVQKMLAKAA